jgi:hypothetical protein
MDFFFLEFGLCYNVKYEDLSNIGDESALKTVHHAIFFNFAIKYTSKYFAFLNIEFSIRQIQS